MTYKISSSLLLLLLLFLNFLFCALGMSATSLFHFHYFCSTSGVSLTCRLPKPVNINKAQPCDSRQLEKQYESIPFSANQCFIITDSLTYNSCKDFLGSREGTGLSHYSLFCV